MGNGARLGPGRRTQSLLRKSTRVGERIGRWKISSRFEADLWTSKAKTFSLKRFGSFTFTCRPDHAGQLGRVPSVGV